MQDSQAMRVTFLYWPECDSHEAALERLTEVLSEERVEHDLEVVEVITEEEARRRGFGGSPTILIDGVDIDPDGRDPAGRLTCRAYRKLDGSIGPLPEKELIRRAIRKRLSGGRDGENQNR